MFLPSSFLNKLKEEKLNYVEIRSNLKTIEDIKQWVEEFGLLTKTQWISRSSNPSGTKILCSKKFVCHHSEFNKVPTEKNIKGNSKNTQCPAYILCTIKLDTPWTRKTDSFVKDGLLASIKIYSCHSHTLETAEALRFLPAKKNLQNTFIEYFNNGMGIIESTKFHEHVLSLNDDFNKKNYANGAINPTYRCVQNWHEQWRLKNLGPRCGSGLIEKLLEKKIFYEKQDIIVNFKEDPFAVVIITPMMKRAHMLRTSSDIIFVDTTSACDPQNHAITFMLAPCAAGAVPLAIIITKGQTYDAYKVGFNLAKEALPSNYSFGCIGYPKIFMTDNSLAEINALNHNWPNSKHLLCVFHVLQAVWRWLWETKNKIPKEKRKDIMKSFQKVLYADTITKAEEAYAIAKHSEFENWNKYLDSYWDFRFKWCLAWRDETVRGHQTNNYSEITVRIFKDVVLSRVKAYNVIALIDFVCTVLNDYYRRRFREFANSRTSKARLFLRAQSKKANDIKPENISQLSETEYIVQMSSDESYEVNTKIGICSCQKGKYGSFCIHQCAIYMHFDAVSVNFPPVTPTDKHSISILADGDDSLPLTFFEPLIPSTSQNKLSCNNDFENLHDTKNDNASKEDQLPWTEVSEVITQEPISVSMESIVTLMNNLNNKYGSSVSGLQQLETRLKKINSEGTWETFLHTAGSSSVPLRKRSGCAIKVQPTSIARRSITLTRGSKRFPVGRPANVENKTQKRKRNLGTNINKNLPNAKPHGRGH